MTQIAASIMMPGPVPTEFRQKAKNQYDSLTAGRVWWQWGGWTRPWTADALISRALGHKTVLREHKALKTSQSEPKDVQAGP